MNDVYEELKRRWREILGQEAGDLSDPEREAIVRWLLGDDPERWEAGAMAVVDKGLRYRWQILRQRYLKVSPSLAYRHLLDRLGASAILRQKVRAWLALSRDRQRAVTDVLQEVIQDMLVNDRHIRACMTSIAGYGVGRDFQNALLFASLEEYALRPIRNQPLLTYRFVNYLRRQSRSGVTKVPREEMIRVLSDEIVTEEGSFDLLGAEALALHEEERAYQETRHLRARVKEGFRDYLVRNLGELAAAWFTLYLSGLSSEAIARELQVEVEQVYRLREKVGYHAIKVFALGQGAESVGAWLEITPDGHNFGLTPGQWESYHAGLTPLGRTIIDALKAGRTLEEIAGSLGLKRAAVVREWKKLYFSARSLRGKS